MPNLYQDNCKYTPLAGGTNSATTTVNPGPPTNSAGYMAPQPPTAPSVFYGVSILSMGTLSSQVVNAYDVIPPTGLGTNTATVTNQLMNGTATAAGQFLSGSGLIGWPGIRYNGALVVTISGSGTLGTANCLWD